jgi:hypothetical protein
MQSNVAKPLADVELTGSGHVAIGVVALMLSLQKVVCLSQSQSNFLINSGRFSMFSQFLKKQFRTLFV